MSEKKLYKNKEWLEKQYFDLNRKVVDIAKECDVNRITINRWLKRYKIPSRKFSSKMLNKMSKEKKGNNTGRENHNWKGNDVSYTNLHTWVRRHKPKPEVCERCGKKQDYLEASNISGEYKRDINDYEYLCVKCHKAKDGVLEKWIEAGIETRFKKGHKNELRYGGIES